MPTKKVAKTQEDVLLSQRDAQRLVGDPLIAETFEQLQEGYKSAWAKTLPEQGELRERAYAHYKAVADVWALLQKKAQSASVRDKFEAAKVAHCPGCGVAESELHKPDCQVLANRLRTERLANG